MASDGRGSFVPLVCHTPPAILTIMAHWSIRQLFVLVLAVLVTAGMGLSVVQAAGVMPEMGKTSMMAGMDESGDQGCKQCGDISGGRAMTCSPICASPLAANPQALFQPVARVAVLFGSLRHLLTGRLLPPEPYPPRPSSFI